jgi:hypothetical protein
MAKRANRVAWGLVVGLAGLVFWGVFDSCRATRHVAERRNSQAELRRAIAEEIPKGTDLAAVLKFLEARRISHTTYDADRRQVNAWISYAPRGWFQFGGGLYMVFWFTKEKKLASYKAKEEWRGL